VVTFGLDVGITVGLFAWVADTLFFGLFLILGGALAGSEIETKTDLRKRVVHIKQMLYGQGAVV